jgi:hypothetical protein
MVLLSNVRHRVSVLGVSQRLSTTTALCSIKVLRSPCFCPRPNADRGSWHSVITKPIHLFNTAYNLNTRTPRFEVLTAVKTSMLVLWVVTPCVLVGRYWRFGEMYCLYGDQHRHLSTISINLFLRWEDNIKMVRGWTGLIWLSIRTVAPVNTVINIHVYKRRIISWLSDY